MEAVFSKNSAAFLAATLQLYMEATLQVLVTTLQLCVTACCHTTPLQRLVVRVHPPVPASGVLHEKIACYWAPVIVTLRLYVSLYQASKLV